MPLGPEALRRQPQWSGRVVFGPLSLPEAEWRARWARAELERPASGSDGRQRQDLRQDRGCRGAAQAGAPVQRSHAMMIGHRWWRHRACGHLETLLRVMAGKSVRIVGPKRAITPGRGDLAPSRSTPAHTHAIRRAVRCRHPPVTGAPALSTNMLCHQGTSP